MKILHGTWIPQPDNGFIQGGSFYLWVETTESKKTRKHASPVHPRQLASAELAQFLSDDLGVQVASHGRNEAIAPQYFLLPSADDQPLPSLELSRYLEEEPPDSFDWRYWQIDCYRTQTSVKAGVSTAAVNNAISLLNDLHFIAIHNLTEIQLGADLLFWYHYTQFFKQVILKDQYIPALKYRVLQAAASQKKSTKTTKSTSKTTSKSTSKTASKTASKSANKSMNQSTRTTARSAQSSRASKSAKSAGSDTVQLAPQSFEIYPGWEIVSELYETELQRYVEAMPYACVAGFAAPEDTPKFHDPEHLLRHFSECLLTDIVTHVQTTQAFEKVIADSLIYSCLNPHHSGMPWTTAAGLKEYQQWQTWRDRITRTQTATSFYLCFQLQAPNKPEDAWLLEFQVAAKSDPSQRLALLDYWRLRPSRQQDLQQQFGNDFEQNLLLGLGYAARIYPKLWSGLETDQPAAISLTLDEAFGFLKESAWVLEDAGYKVIVPAWWTPKGRQRAKVRLKAAGKQPTSSKKDKSYFSFDTLVDYQYELAIGDQVISEREWQQLVNAKTPLVQFRGQWVELDQDKMRALLEFWKTQQHEHPDMTLLDFMKLTADADDSLELDWERDQRLSEMLTRLNDKSRLEVISDPAGFQGSLREYQKRGVSWLHYLESLGLNGCLADDMGLGKSAQVIARLLQERELTSGAKKSKKQIAIAPTLLVVPTSVVGNWSKEIEKFAPQLRVLVHHGSQRLQDDAAFKAVSLEHDVVITSFTLARKDVKRLEQVDWHRVVVDEAQNIKNPKAAQTKAILKLPAQHRLALTGTPVENRLLDLWSIFNFLNPGYLGKEAQFRQSFEIPIQKNNDVVRSTTLKKLVEPFILRRMKTDQSIIKDLPDKVEQKLYCNLTKEQASLYEAVVKDIETQLSDAEGIQRKGLILSTLMKLKQICNHPMQFLQDNSDFTPERSHKLERLLEMIEEAMDEGESLLVFTQFTDIGDALEKYLRHTLHYNTYYLHGGTPRPKRERMIAEFQNPDSEPSVFILSLKAGGVGITLTKANHVFHFDRWWNPAVEDQATDRAFRIGQTKNVFVHKFVALGTLEERIDQMIEDKKKLAGAIVGADESWLTELDNDAFKQLIALNRTAILE
jgi:SNF2 family DNA or RNA helicase